MFNARTDRNQKDLVKALRGIGAIVWPTHRLGGGFPDLLVGFKKTFYLYEIKDPQQPPSGRLLTGPEEKFFRMFLEYPVHKVETFLQCYDILTK